MSKLINEIKNHASNILYIFIQYYLFYGAVLTFLIEGVNFTNYATMQCNFQNEYFSETNEN